MINPSAALFQGVGFGASQMLFQGLLPVSDELVELSACQEVLMLGGSHTNLSPHWPSVGSLLVEASVSQVITKTANASQTLTTIKG